MKEEFVTATLNINSAEELHEHEQEIVGRIEKFPNGGNLFMIHPFLLFEEIGVRLSEGVKDKIISLEPSLANLSDVAYKALKVSKEKQNVTFHVRGLFRGKSE